MGEKHVGVFYYLVAAKKKSNAFEQDKRTRAGPLENVAVRGSPYLH